MNIAQVQKLYQSVTGVYCDIFHPHKQTNIIYIYTYDNVYVEHKTFEVCNTDNFKRSCSKEHCLKEHENVKRY